MKIYLPKEEYAIHIGGSVHGKLVRIQDIDDGKYTVMQKIVTDAHFFHKFVFVIEKDYPEELLNQAVEMLNPYWDKMFSVRKDNYIEDILVNKIKSFPEI